MKLKTMILLTVFAGASLLRPRPARAEVAVSFSFFYDELSPYGCWESGGRWGDCWVPANVAAGWQPYTDGEWIYTDYGWTWVSYDPWGGDPYHYGSWAWEDPWGWVWVPGTVWAPAWVTWGYSDSYVGWAPIPPNVSISYGGYSGAAIVVPQSRSVFVPVNQFAGVRVSSVRLPVHQNAAIFPHVRKLTSYSVSRGVVVNRGPSVSTIERAGRVRIPKSSMSEAKSRPVPLSASGARRGQKIAIVAPAAARAREIAQHRERAGAPPPVREVSPGHNGNAKSTSGGRHEAAPKHGAAPKHEAAPRHEAPPPKSEPTTSHEVTPPKHEAHAPKHEAAPPKHAHAPKHEAPPPASQEAPPPAKHEAAPPRHEEAAPPHAAPAHPPAEHRPPPARKQEPPPPPARREPHGPSDSPKA